MVHPTRDVSHSRCNMSSFPEHVGDPTGAGRIGSGRDGQVSSAQVCYSLSSLEREQVGNRVVVEKGRHPPHSPAAPAGLAGRHRQTHGRMHLVPEEK